MLAATCNHCTVTYLKRWKSELKRAKYCSRKCQTDAIRHKAIVASMLLASRRRKRSDEAAGRIYLPGALSVLVDPDDYNVADSVLWYLHSQGYAVNKTRTHGVRLLHRVIMQRTLGRPLARKEQVDHINHDKLDCRRLNLRLSTASQNAMNMVKPAHNRSGYKGVGWSSQKRKWKASIKLDRQTTHLGFFEDSEQAALAYDAAAIQLFGVFAYTNTL